MVTAVMVEAFSLHQTVSIHNTICIMDMQRCNSEQMYYMLQAV